MSEKRCPVCGQGVLQHLGTETGDEPQDAGSRIREIYTCGHEVEEPPLSTADSDRLEVERRESSETTDPT